MTAKEIWKSNAIPTHDASCRIFTPVLPKTQQSSNYPRKAAPLIDQNTGQIKENPNNYSIQSHELNRHSMVNTARPLSSSPKEEFDITWLEI
ncbi:hypothetical protein RRG08_028067 [Elysia crispata]|uniref:Uncharacterized protein n=1 Tax=Elysia crispata TaxID=231223 RepID=A0AAE1A7R5_9GAST|nr:hypothetical protein RRG08_028067 [Elysia crispata]